MPKKTVRVFDYGDIKSITYNSVLSYYEITDYEVVIREAVKKVCGPMSLPMKVRYNGPGGKARCVSLEDSFFLVGLCVATKENAADLLAGYLNWFKNKFKLPVNKNDYDMVKKGAYHAANTITWISKEGMIDESLPLHAQSFYDTL